MKNLKQEIQNKIHNIAHPHLQYNSEIDWVLKFYRSVFIPCNRPVTLMETNLERSKTRWLV